MGEVVYKIWPYGWLRDGNYLLATKEVAKTSYGKEFTRYIVVQKHFNYFPIEKSGLVGVHYNPTELRLIEKLNQ